MASLPEPVSKAWDRREGAVVFATVDKAGVPNAIYATCVSRFDDQTIVVADNYFNKTRQNIAGGSRGTILFITNEKKSFQIKGTVRYHTEGPVFEDMKKWNPASHPGHAAAALQVEEVYSGAERLV